MASRRWQGLAWKDLLNNASVSEKEWYLADPSVREAEAPTPVQGGDTLLYHVSQRSVVPGGTPHLHFHFYFYFYLFF